MDPATATRAVFDAWERGDARAVGDLFCEDGRYEDPLFPEPVVGPSGISEAVAPAMQEIRDLRIPVKHLVVEGHVAVCEASFLSELASAEGRMDFDFAMVVEMRDGKIARLAEFFDTRPLTP